MPNDIELTLVARRLYTSAAQSGLLGDVAVHAYSLLTEEQRAPWIALAGAAIEELQAVRASRPALAGRGDQKPSDVRDAAQKRIDALESLLVCYRVGSRPTEALHDKLQSSKIAWAEVRAALSVDQGAKP